MIFYGTARAASGDGCMSDDESEDGGRTVRVTIWAVEYGMSTVRCPWQF